MPGVVERDDERWRVGAEVRLRQHARIGHAPVARVDLGLGGDRLGGVGPALDAVLTAAAPVAIARLAVHEAGIGDALRATADAAIGARHGARRLGPRLRRHLAAVAAHRPHARVGHQLGASLDVGRAGDGARRVVPLLHVRVAAEPGALRHARVSDRQPAACWSGAARDGSRSVGPAHERVDVVVATTLLVGHVAVEAGIRNGVRPRPWRSLRRHAARRLVHRHDAVGLVAARVPAARVGDRERAIARQRLARHSARRLVHRTDAKHALPPVLVDARIGDAELAVGRQRFARHRGARLVPTLHAVRAVAPVRADGNDPDVAQIAVLHGQLVKRPPVLASGNEREPQPGHPRQARQPVHRSEVRGLWHGHRADDLADRLHPLLGRLVQERRDLLRVPSDEQVAVAVLTQTAQLATVVREAIDLVAVPTQHGLEDVEQLAAPRLDARHVLQHDERGRVVLERFERQRDAVHHEAVERLVLRRCGGSGVEQAGDALTRRRAGEDVGALAKRIQHVGRRRFAPARRRLAAVERDVVVALEQVHQDATAVGDTAERVDRDRPGVDAAEAAHRGLRAADAGVPVVEAERQSAGASEQAGVGDLDVVGVDELQDVCPLRHLGVPRYGWNDRV